MQLSIIISSVFLSILLASQQKVCAQFTISRPDTEENEELKPLVTTQTLRPLANGFFDYPTWRVKKMRLRKERNTITLVSSLQASMLQFENWTGSGANSFSGLATVYFRHLYEKSKLTVDYSLGGAYGINVIDDMPFKNKDEFKVSGQVMWGMKRNWAYSASMNFRSQFTVGYKSRTEKIKHSNFLSPGYFDIAGGFTYSKKGFPVKVTLSPIGGSLTMIIDEEVSQLDMYGVPIGKRLHGKIGPSVNIFYEQSYGINKIIMLRSELYAFTAYDSPWDTPVIRWENTLDMRLTRFLTASTYIQIYYLKEASTKLQYQYSFTIGLSYTFRNK